MKIEEIARLAKEASIKLGSIPSKKKNQVLKEIAATLMKNSKSIISSNDKDMEEARRTGLNIALQKRLQINEDKIKEMIEEIKGVIELDDPVGKILAITNLDKGLTLNKVTCPIGVIGAIFESRPDVVTQISALCLKSGNAVILKGGSEAKQTNQILVKLITDAILKVGMPKGSVQLIETREQVADMLNRDSYIDLIIPRGSNSFVRYIQENTRIAVLGHSAGICHVYIDKDADIKKAVDIAYDAKCQYPAVCNAMETLLVNKKISKKFLPLIIKKYRNAKVEIRGDELTNEIVQGIGKATEQDWATEYNDLVISIKIVDGLDEAINHINKYGSKHTDAIVTENKKAADIFMSLVDSSSVVWNASTRFADGFRYGLGAEVGISTGKVHARGPVGLEGLVTYKYKLVGKGNVVADYASFKKKFIHKKIK